VISTHLLRQLFFFGAVGLTATITNYVAAIVFYEHLGLNLYAAQFSGYSLAVAISLFGHSRLTFDARITSSILLKFVVVSLTTLLLSEALLLSLETFLSVSHRISLLVVVFTIPVITFFLSKLWVFQERSSQEFKG
jgi:putative flippase GtrA